MVRIHPDPPHQAWVLEIGRRRGCSSAGRAPALQAGGRRFDPDQLHHEQRAEPSARRGGCAWLWSLAGRYRLFFNKAEVARVLLGRAGRGASCGLAGWARSGWIVSARVLSSSGGAGGASTRDAGRVSVQCYGVKRLSACGGCLGDHRRRRTWQPAKSCGELASEQ
jgi:hypothetical protein